MAFEGSQLDVHLTLSFRLVRFHCQGAMFPTRPWDIRCAVRWFFLEVDPSTCPASGDFEDIQICYPASNTTGLSWELWRVVVCIFILVYLHHNEKFHMNGAREPFLFANSLEGWDTAQFDSNRFLLLVEKLESYPCFAPTHLVNYSVFF